MTKKILLVEDDKKFRDAIMLIFEGGDYTFLEASSVKEGLKLTREHPDVQVVLLDLNLPGGTGADFLEGLRAEIAEYRVIVLTAHEELLVAEAAKSYEVFSYAAKAGTSLRESLRFQIERAFEDLEKAWLRKKIDAHLEIERKVVLIGQDAGKDTDRELREVMESICGSALDLTGAYTCHIRLFDPGRGDFMLWASKGKGGHVRNIFQPRVRHNEPYSGIVAETKEPLAIADLQNHPPFVGMLKAALDGESDPLYLSYLRTARSAYVVPISTGIFGHEVDAVFNINSDVMDFFSTEERRELVHDFVTQTALAYTKYLLRKKRLEIHADYMNISKMLGEVSDVLEGEYDLDVIYEIVLRRLSDGLKPEIISIFLFDNASGRLKNVAEFRADKRQGRVGEEYALDEGMVGHIFSKKRTERLIPALRHPDEALAKALAQEREKLGDIPSGELRHYLGVPIRIGNSFIGVIRAVNKRSEYYEVEEEKTSGACLLKRGFSEDCQLELEMAASHLAVAVKNEELLGKVKKKMSRYEAIKEVGKRIGSERDVRALQQLIVTEAAKFMHAEICMLFLTSERRDKIVLKQSHGMPFTEMEDVSYDIGEGKTGKVAQTWSPILEEQARKDHRGKYDDRIIEFLREKHGGEAVDIESFMAVPIIGEGRILGVIKIINKVEPPYEFDDDDLELFQMFASQIALVRFLYTSYSYQKDIVDYSPDPIIFLDREGKVEVFNEACERLWGYSAAEVLGRPVVELYVSKEQARRIGKQLWESPEQRIQNVEEEIRHQSGESIPVSLSAAILFDERKQLKGSMGVFKDLREIKQLQDQILRAQRDAVVGKLASTFGHDIKHDIGAALNYIGTLLRKCDPERQPKLHEIYVDIDESLRESIAKLKNVFAAVEPEPLQEETVCVGELFSENMINKMRRHANRNNVEFEFTCPDLEAELSVDVEQIKTALWNLFDNSLDAMDKKRADGLPYEKGSIKVSVNVKSESLEMIWKDSGCGMPKEKIPLIFLPYWTDKRNGNGVGLHKLKTSVEMHGGKVSVDSTEGEGTTFQVTIPLAAE